MKRHQYFILPVLLIVLIRAVALNMVSASPLLGSGAPTVVSYQGVVKESGTPYTGTGYFKFAVVNAAGDTSYWSNNGTSSGGAEPTAGVQLTVSEGLFHLLLGDTSLTNMTSLSASVFSGTERYLRVWFSSDDISFTLLSPDQQFAAVPYALQAQEAADADTVDGFHASDLETHYQNVIIVAKSGGDFSTVQAAIDSITDAASDNPYLVWVAPGEYSETVTLKPYVHLQGAGQEATIITSTASNVSILPTQATLVLASDVSLRDLTAENSGGGNCNVALLATGGVARTLVADVSVRTQGSGTNNFAIFLYSSGTEVTLQQVTAVGENGSDENYGLLNSGGAAATLHGGSFTGRGGWNAIGINSKTTLEAMNVTALGENASNINTGLHNSSGATATLHGGSFTGSGGSLTNGIYNEGSGSTLEATNVTALGESGSGYNYGLYNSNVAAATLRGVSFAAYGGSDAYGIYNTGSSTTLEATNITVLGKNGSGNNLGLYNNLGSAATLRRGSFAAYGGSDAYGIYNTGSSTTLEATNVTVLGESGSGFNYGLYNSTVATANIIQSVLEGASYSVYRSSGSVTVSHSRLVGSGVSGTVTCVLVTRGSSVSTDGSTCP